MVGRQIFNIQNQGFSLIELLVSVALVGMSILVLSQSSYQAAKKQLEREVIEDAYRLKTEMEGALSFGCNEAMGGQSQTGEISLNFTNAKFQGLSLYGRNYAAGQTFGPTTIESVRFSPTPRELDGGAFSNTLTLQTASNRAPWLPSRSQDLDIVYWRIPGSTAVNVCGPNHSAAADCLKMGTAPGCSHTTNLVSTFPTFFCLQAGLPPAACSLNTAGFVTARDWIRTLIQTNGGFL